LLPKEPQFDHISELYGIDTLTLFQEKAVVHKLSHQHLYTRFWIAHTQSKLDKGTPFKEIHQFAVPVLISNFISNFASFN